MRKLVIILKRLLFTFPKAILNKTVLRFFKRNFFIFLVVFLINSLTFSFIFVHSVHDDGANANAIAFDVLDPRNFDRSNIGGSVEMESNNVPQRKINANERAPVPIVTLFTTMKFSDQRNEININTLTIWASMRPWAKVVLFTTSQDDPKWGAKAEELGFHVYPAPRLRLGVPILKDMFTFILDISPATPFVGYANSDILFTSDLNTTLHALHHASWDKFNGSGVLLTGRRTDTLVSKIIKLNSVKMLEENNPIPPDAKPASGYSLDYFITYSPNKYPWQRVPDFVVGKPGYDNWLVIKALEWKVTLIDLTLTVQAMHQVLDTKNKDSGWFAKNVCMNRELFDPFSVVRGHSDCSPYFSKKLLGGTIIIYERTREIRDCMPEVPVWGSSRHITCMDIVKKLKIKESRLVQLLKPLIEKEKW